MKKQGLLDLGVALAILVILFFVVESGLQLGFRLKTGQWFFAQKERQVDFFVFHPYLIGRGKPFAKASEKNVVISHNSLGYRGSEISLKKPPEVKRIAIFGGSSVYCTGVSDDQTWPEQLAGLLGKSFEVINAGVPGYSTVEHIIQTSLLASDLSADICIYYVGWNDMRNFHIKGLRSDYSDFHALYQFDNLGLSTPRRLYGSLTVYYFVKMVNRLFSKINVSYRVTGSSGQFTATGDARALELYKRNIRSIIALCRVQHMRPVMVPQVLNYDAFAPDASDDWMPFIRGRDVRPVLDQYNKALAQVCREEKADFIEGVLFEKFDRSCFIDNGHFSAKGSKAMARVIQQYLLAYP